MHRPLSAIVLGSLLLAGAAGCVTEPDVGSASQALGACGLGDEELATRTYTTADIPTLSAVQQAQFIAAVRESAWNDITTIQEAFLHADDHEIREIILRDSGTNQFYAQVEAWFGDNRYGAIFYWGTAVEGGAIHDGDPSECGPSTFNYDTGDTAPECSGFLTYANTASLAALDAYLPSNVAAAIVAARTQHAFDSVASVVAVNGVAEARLQQILAAARTSGAVTATCSGIYDQLALSTGEATATVAFVDEVSKNELDGTLAFLINHTVINTLLANRPYTTVGAISATSGVGPAVLRALRNAATSYQPFEQLVDAVNAIDHPDGQTRLDTHFDWVPLVTSPGAGLTAMDCFGPINPSLLPAGATLRATPANGNEVMENIGSDAISIANRFGELAIDATPGLTDLDFRTFGSSFLGCYVTYHPTPWQYDTQAFFVDTATGASVLHTFHYVE